MTNKEALEILIDANLWRRDNSDKIKNRIEMPDPKQLGLAIDKAIEVLKRFEKLKELIACNKVCCYMDTNQKIFEVLE
jgi:hypothetical protein